jgi:hypothetical protein
MAVQAQRSGVDDEAADPALLGRLALGGGAQREVAGFAVAPGLQPATELSVQGEQHTLAGRVDDESAGGHMVGMAVAPQAVGLGTQVFEVRQPQLLLSRLVYLQLVEHAHGVCAQQ